MSKTRLILASVLALTAAACGQLNQGKAAEQPAEGSAAPADAATPDGKPAEGAGDAAAKPEGAEAPAGTEAAKPE